MESKLHLNGKKILGQLFSELGYPLIVMEHMDADVLAYRDNILTCAEFENSSRNVIRNLERNVLIYGANKHLIACPSFKVLGEVAHKLHRDCPPELISKVGVMDMNALQVIIGQ